jgi:Protein of unknown function (DUF2874).
VKPAFTCIILAAFFLAVAVAADKPLTLKDLPPAIQKAVLAQTKGAEIKGLSKEVANGKTEYEVETILKGHTRDLMLDASGGLISVEEEATLDSIPGPAKAAIQKQAVGGKVTRVEILTKGKAVAYEAGIDKGGKASEVAVKADGTKYTE